MNTTSFRGRALNRSSNVARLGINSDKHVTISRKLYNTLYDEDCSSFVFHGNIPSFDNLFHQLKIELFLGFTVSCILLSV